MEEHCNGCKYGVVQEGKIVCVGSDDAEDLMEVCPYVDTDYPGPEEGLSNKYDE